jgi:type III secretion system low calcium response chaperone LcrH/SycD
MADSTPLTAGQEAYIARASGHFAAGGTLGDLHGMEDRDYEAMYAVAHGMYAQERYRDAQKLFNFLVACNPFDRRFHQALASSLQMTADYEQAISYYSMASVMDMKDPIPTFHTAECLAALGRVPEAREALQIVIEQSSSASHALLKQRATGLLELLSRQPS